MADTISTYSSNSTNSTLTTLNTIDSLNTDTLLECNDPYMFLSKIIEYKPQQKII